MDNTKLELMDYKGCGCCDKCGKEFDCSAHTVPITVRFNKSELWDNCGHFVTVFRKDDIVTGEAVVDDNKVYCITAESTLYEGIDDFISLENVEIIE